LARKKGRLIKVLCFDVQRNKRRGGKKLRGSLKTFERS